MPFSSRWVRLLGEAGLDQLDKPLNGAACSSEPSRDDADGGTADDAEGKKRRAALGVDAALLLLNPDGGFILVGLLNKECCGAGSANRPDSERRLLSQTFQYSPISQVCGVELVVTIISVLRQSVNAFCPTFANRRDFSVSFPVRPLYRSHGIVQLCYKVFNNYSKIPGKAGRVSKHLPNLVEKARNMRLGQRVDHWHEQGGQQVGGADVCELQKIDADALTIV